MKKTIKVKTGSRESKYAFSENPNGKGILVKVPYLKSVNNRETVRYDTVEVRDKKKIQFIMRFFIEGSIALVYNGTAYVIDEILFDEVPVPLQNKRQELDA